MKKTLFIFTLTSIGSLFSSERPLHTTPQHSAHFENRPLIDGTKCDEIYTAFVRHYLNAQQAWKRNDKKECARSAIEFAHLKKVMLLKPCILSTGESLENALKKLTKSND